MDGAHAQHSMADIKRVVIEVDNNQGYAPDQVVSGMTLHDLHQLVEDAIHDHGGDCIVVTKDSGNRYGARWGGINPFSDIESVDDENEDDEDE